MPASAPIKDRIEKYRTLISPVRDKNEPVYNWHTFKHSYSKKLVEELVADFGLRKNAWVLDPFSGGGTTLLACKELGINSKGFDILPFSVFLSNVKTRSYDPEKLKGYLAEFKLKKNPILRKEDAFPDINIINLAFPAAVRKQLLGLRSQIEKIKDDKSRDFYMLGLLSILESVSNAAKAGGFLRIIDNKVNSQSVRPTFIDRIEAMIDDVENFNSKAEGTSAVTDTELGDARNFPISRKYDAIITSPPYPNRHDYTRIYALELILNFVRDNAELKKIRYDTLRSHVEARKRFEKEGYVIPLALKKSISKIKAKGINNRKVPQMIEGYFEDMYLVLRQMKKSLKKNGKIALVVSNVRFSGVNIEVDCLLSEIGRQVGLTPTAVLMARYRGNSAQQMETYTRKASRESIVIWENR